VTTEAAPPAKTKPKVKVGAINGTKPTSPIPPEAEEPKVEVIEATKDEESEDVMDLTSLVPTRKLIKVPTADGGISDAYELRLLDDFGIIEQQKLLNWSRRFEKLWNEEERDLTPEEQTTLKWLLDKMFDKVLMAPDEIKAEMSDSIRSRVVTAFTLVPLLERQKQEQEAQEKEEQAKKDSALTSES
jgi:hypothetical protein